jgi:hypothetical protein
MQRCAAAALAGLLLAACAPLPPEERPGPERTRTVALGFDETWRRVLDSVADEGIPLKEVARESGVLYAEGLIPRNPALADCGRGRSWSALPQTALAVNVFVRPDGSGTRVTVNARYTQMYASGLDQRFVLCRSTGALEERIFAALR